MNPTPQKAKKCQHQKLKSPVKDNQSILKTLQASKSQIKVQNPTNMSYILHLSNKSKTQSQLEYDQSSQLYPRDSSHTLNTQTLSFPNTKHIPLKSPQFP